MYFFSFSLILLSNFSLLLGLSNSQYQLIEDAFERLKDDPINLSNHGYLCETLAVEHMMEKYDEKLFSVHSGLVYHGKRGIIGELDLVVTRNDNQKVVMIGEVKCKSRVFSALKKAKGQLQRFVSSIRPSKNKIYFSYPYDYVFKLKDFNHKYKRSYVSYLGTVKKGFTDELAMTFESIKILHRKLVSYSKYH